MRLFGILLLSFLFIGLTVLFVGLLFLLSLYPSDTSVFEPYNFNVSRYVISNNTQFYENMRYRDKKISYFIEEACDSEKVKNVKQAFSILSNKTILSFYESNNGEIKILCSEVAPDATEAGHFVAGEGGPSEIINTSYFAVIFSGKVSLFREEKCEESKVALHEILHALGFDHNVNQKSIMYPVTDCKQEIDSYIISEINSLYSIPSEGDLIIENVNVSKSGRYLNFNIFVANYGFKNIENSSVVLYADNELVKSFDLDNIDIGTRKYLTVKNVRIARDVGKVDFVLVTQSEEISKENNRATVNMIMAEEG